MKVGNILLVTATLNGCPHKNLIEPIAAGIFILTVLILVLKASTFGKTKAP